MCIRDSRLCGVTADVGGHSYMNYLKVPAKVDELCAILQEDVYKRQILIGNNLSIIQILNLFSCKVRNFFYLFLDFIR